MQFPLRALALAVTINLLWGANVPAVKVGLVAFPPLWSAFFRFVLGVGCIALWAWWRGVSLRPRRDEWRGLILLAGLFTVQIWVMNLGIQLTTSALASILLATNPLFTSFLAHLTVPGDRLRPARIAGLILAFGGIMVVFFPAMGSGLGLAAVGGNLVCLLSAALLGGRLVFSSRLLQRIETTRLVVWQMLFSLPFFALAAALTEEIRWENLTWEPIAAIAYQGIVVAGFNFMGMAWLLRDYSPSIVVGFNFISPLFGVMLSAWMLGDIVGWPLLAGMAAVGGGLLLITRK